MNIFDNNDAENPMTLIRKTMKVYTDDNGISFVSFSTNKGKGSGVQSIPVSEFEDYVSALESIVDNGVPEKDSHTYTAAEMVQRTVSQKDGIVSFRVQDGKGSKPAKIPSNLLKETVSLLRSTVAAVIAATESEE